MLRSPRGTAAAALLMLSATAAWGDVTATHAWIRGMAPGQTSAAAYLTLQSSADAKVVAVSSSVAGKAELHASMVMSGVAHMHGIDALELPAGKPVELKPGGNHVMLMQLAHTLRAGEEVALVFTVEEKGGRRSKLEVKARVTPIAE